MPILDQFLADRPGPEHTRRLTDEIHLWRFPRGRDWRALLAAYDQRPVEAMPWRTGRHGKPKLADASLRFNLSHSGEFGVLAVAAHVEVGVDLERTRCLSRRDALLARCFDEEERAWLAHADARTLLRAWTVKEALVKAHGRGIAYGLRRIRTRAAADHVDLAAVAGEAGPVQRWRLTVFRIGEDYEGALVAAAPGGLVRGFDLI